MTLERMLAKTFALDNKTWLRHANPWSVILRNTVLPTLVLAFWSRIWISWWAVIPVAAALLWIWINPRIFPAPQSLEHWSSKAVLGERVWLNRDVIPVPVYHRTVPNILSIIAGLGMVFVFWGVLTLNIWATVFGMVLVYCGKLWFLDRMVWLWQDMKEVNEEYRSWQNLSDL